MSRSVAPPPPSPLPNPVPPCFCLPMFSPWFCLATLGLLFCQTCSTALYLKSHGVDRLLSPSIQTAPAPPESHPKSNRAWNLVPVPATAPGRKRFGGGKSPQGVKTAAIKKPTAQNSSRYRRAALEARDVAPKIERSPPSGLQRTWPEPQANASEVPQVQSGLYSSAKVEDAPVIYHEEVLASRPGDPCRQPDGPKDCVPWAGHSVPPTKPCRFCPHRDTGPSSMVTWGCLRSHLPPDFCAISPLAFGHGQYYEGLPSGLARNNFEVPLGGDGLLSSSSSTILYPSLGQAWPPTISHGAYQLLGPEIEPPAATIGPFLDAGSSVPFAGTGGEPGCTTQYGVAFSPFLEQYCFQNAHPPVFRPAPLAPQSHGGDAAVPVPLSCLGPQTALPAIGNEPASSHPAYLADGPWASWVPDLRGPSPAQFPFMKSEDAHPALHGCSGEAYMSQELPHVPRQDVALLPFQSWSSSQDWAFQLLEAPAPRDPVGFPHMQDAASSVDHGANLGVQMGVDHEPGGHDDGHEARPEAKTKKRAVPAPDAEPAHPREASHRSRKQRATGTTAPEGVKPRKPFPESDRKETSRTRDIGACVRCKMQRVRVRCETRSRHRPLLVSSIAFWLTLTSSVGQTHQTQMAPAWAAAKWPTTSRRRSFITSAATGTSSRRSPSSGHLPRTSLVGGRAHR